MRLYLRPKLNVRNIFFIAHGDVLGNNNGIDCPASKHNRFSVIYDHLVGGGRDDLVLSRAININCCSNVIGSLLVISAVSLSSRFHVVDDHQLADDIIFCCC